MLYWLADLSLALATGSGLPAGERRPVAALIALGAGALAFAGYVVIRRNRPR